MNNKTLVFIEIQSGHVANVSKEIISHAQNNFKNSEINGAIIIDESSISFVLDEIKNLGLDNLYILKDNLFDETNTCIFAEVLANLIKDTMPDVLLMGATVDGRDLAPRTAAKLNIGLTADCTNLQLDENGKLLATRPTYGGKMMATIISKTSPDFATVREGAFKQIWNDFKKCTNVIEYKPKINGVQSLIEVLRCSQKPSKDNWTCSEIIVAGGLGLKSKKNFELIYKFAEVINAKPAASRAAVEQNWAPQSIQIGQTGSSVSPKLYIAFGISGAIQHMVGITNADRIIAINTDKNAPIMQSADCAIVGDAIAVLNELITISSN